MKKLLFLLLFIPALSLFSQSQLPIESPIDSRKGPQFSVITLGAGANLNDSFGHNAFRYKDETNNIDQVYDYGRFDFDTPNFYLKFGRGKLPYALGKSSYQIFVEYYKSQERTIKEQLLDLTAEETVVLFEFLENNFLPMNRNYNYDFFYDNCATKIRDVLINVLGNKLKFSNTYVEDPKTFRTLIQERLNRNSWGSLGIDIALGAVIDRKATPWEHQFLPEFIYLALSELTIQQEGVETPLVKESIPIYDVAPQKESPFFLTSPLFIFSLSAIFICVMTYRDITRNKRSRWLDSLLFLITGIVGCIVLLLWFGTDHTATASNYNLLWAMPLNALFFTLIGRKTPKKWVYRYLLFLILMLILLGVHWISGVQIFAISLVPLLFALGVRYLYLIRHLKDK